VYVDSVACWTANALFNAAGFIAALSAWDVLLSHKYRRLLWLVPAILVSAWLEGAFNSGVASQALEQGARLSAQYRRMGMDLMGWPVLGLAFVSLRRALPFGRPRSTISHSSRMVIKAEGDSDAGLQGAVERFIEAADKADVAAVAALYDPAFACVRVADEGGFVHLTREQMVAFWQRAGGGSHRPGSHSVPTRETVLHHAEVVGDTGFVLLTRVKDLGSGWEPIYYSLVWTKQDSDWLLMREFVHQRTVPRWR
jgi:Domain of unknown function (DUF4440)